MCAKSKKKYVREIFTPFFTIDTRDYTNVLFFGRPQYLLFYTLLCLVIQDGTEAILVQRRLRIQTEVQADVNRGKFVPKVFFGLTKRQRLLIDQLRNNRSISAGQGCGWLLRR